MAKNTKNIPAPKKTLPTESKTKKANIYDVIKFENQLYRVSQTISQFRENIRVAESILAPQRYQLYQTYIDSCEDSHLSGVMNSYYDLILSREINFYNKDGKINEEASKLLHTKWFMDFATYALQSKSWGFSCIQLEDIDRPSERPIGMSPVELPDSPLNRAGPANKAVESGLAENCENRSYPSSFNALT